jgi:hypothetical protein
MFLPIAKRSRRHGARLGARFKAACKQKNKGRRNGLKK